MKYFTHPLLSEMGPDYGSWAIGTTLKRINFSPSYIVTIREFVACTAIPHCSGCLSHGIQMSTLTTSFPQQTLMGLKCIARRGMPPFWQVVEEE